MPKVQLRRVSGNYRARYDTGSGGTVLFGGNRKLFTRAVTKSVLCILLVGSVLGSITAGADELTRQVQEELRRRHLYYSDIDGRSTGDVAAALKKFQERQGFPVTGIPDDQTLLSLGIISEPSAPADSGAESLPDIPVLRSDSALQNHQTNPPILPAPLPHINSAPPTPKEVREFVRKYFAACASPNVHDEIDFFADRVDYFDHGAVDRAYIENEVATYNQRWTRRSYKVGNLIAVTNAPNKVVAKARVDFQVANGPNERQANAQTDDTIGITRRPDGTGLQIVTIEESRITSGLRWRRTSRRDRDDSDAVVHGVQRAFRTIFSGGHKRRWH